eukprot:147271_1
MYTTFNTENKRAFGTTQEICRFYGSVNGCRYGNNCRYLHANSKTKQNNIMNSPISECFKGNEPEILYKSNYTTRKMALIVDEIPTQHEEQRKTIDYKKKKKK